MPLIRLSAKRSFIILKEKSPIHCNELKSNVKITKIFYQHISGANKRRSQQEEIKRLLLVPFIDLILKKGKIISEKNKKDGKYFRISVNINTHKVSVIIVKGKQDYFLISCFFD